MTRAFISILNAHSIGDTINQMFMDVLVQKTSDEQYWLLHTSDSQITNTKLTDGWIHFELFNLYKKAGLYQNLIYINGINNSNYNQGHAAGNWVHRNLMRDYISKVYSRRYHEVHLGVPVEIGSTVYMPEELRERFSFLKTDEEQYSTIQCLSTHYNTGKILPKLYMDAFLHGPHQKIKFTGSLVEKQRVQEQIDILKLDNPDIEMVNCCGVNIEEYFRIIYNTESNLSTESSSSLLAAQLGILSIIHFVYRAEMDIWKKKFKDVPTLTFV